MKRTYNKMVNNGSTGITVAPPPPPRVNPAVPDSNGGLLAEEWTIDHSSTLPSFMERMIMEEGRRSGWQSLRSILGFLEERTFWLLRRYQQHDDYNVNNVENTRKWDHLLRRWLARIANAFLQRIIKPFGPEIRFMILYMVERRSLLFSNAMIIEALYGGKRVKLGGTILHSSMPNSSQYKGEERGRKRSLGPISKNDSIRLAFLMAFSPYLEERSEFFFQYILELFSSSPKRASNETSFNSTTRNIQRNKLQIILNTVWPFLRMTIKGTFLWYRWRYLLGQSVFFDPYSRYLNIILRRVTKEDQQQKQQNKTPAVSETVVKENSMLTTDAIHGLQDLVQSRGLRLTAVGITSSLAALMLTGRIRSVRQELRQEHELHIIRQEQQRQQRQSDQEGDLDYQSSNMLFKENMNNKILPPPPSPVPSSYNSSNFGKYNSAEQNLAACNPNICPLCNESRIHPTASTGGYVFCLKCLLVSIRQRPFCPVTGSKCPESSLIRLYEPTRT